RVPRAAASAGSGTAAVPLHRQRQVPASGPELSAGWHTNAPPRRTWPRCATRWPSPVYTSPWEANMTERGRRLRRSSLDARPWVSLERAKLLTEFCRQAGPLFAPMLRARALEYIYEHRSIYIGPEELIVGERGPRPKGTPTYPELCCHSLEDFE